MYDISGVLLGRLDEITAEVVDAIRADLPAYGEVVPLPEHTASARAQIERVLIATRDGLDPAPADLTAAEHFGRDRGRQGLPVTVLFEAYRWANLVLWRHLARLSDTGPDAARALLDRVPALLTWSHALAGAAAYGHQMVSAQRISDDLRMRYRLFELIRTDPGGAECAGLLRRLGVSPDAELVAVAFTPRPDEDFDRLLLRVRPVAAGLDATVFTVVATADAGPALCAAVRPLALDGLLGIGRRRTGAEGARVSVDDSARALRVAERLGHDAEFSADWLLATVLPEQQRLDLLDPGRQVAVEHPHLAATVAAYIAAEFSVTATARRQHLHPNSVSYRLERWEALTGWRLKTFDGLVRSRVAIDLAGGRAG